jgi:hypothetical protein
MTEKLRREKQQQKSNDGKASTEEQQGKDEDGRASEKVRCGGGR